MRLDDKLITSFEPHRVRWYRGISFEIKRSMGGSVATSIIKNVSNSTDEMMVGNKWVKS